MGRQAESYRKNIEEIFLYNFGDILYFILFFVLFYRWKIPRLNIIIIFFFLHVQMDLCLRASSASFIESSSLLNFMRKCR